jgi:hypothetical protein
MNVKLKSLVLFTFTLLSFTSISNGDSVIKHGLYSTSIVINNGAKINVSDHIEYKSLGWFIPNPNKFLNGSNILNNYETDGFNISDIASYINRIQSGRELGYWNILDINNSVTDSYYFLYEELIEKNVKIYEIYSIARNKTTLFNKYYHRLFQNKQIRILLFNEFLDVVVNECIKHPKDFTLNVLDEIKSLKNITSSISNYYQTDFNKSKSYWAGFINRRVEVDNIPIDEVFTYLCEVENRLKEIQLEHMADGLYELKINNEISIIITSKEYVVQSLSSTNMHSYSFSNEIQTVKYISDSTGEFYLIEGDGFRHLFNKEMIKFN